MVTTRRERKENPNKKTNPKKMAAPGEVRTHNLRMSWHASRGSTVYKYGALTDCATGAADRVHGILLLWLQ